MLGRADGRVHLVAVRSAEHEEVDVTHRPITRLAREPRRPRPIDVDGVDPPDFGERLAEHPRDTERLDQHVRQSAEVRAGLVGTDEAGSSDEPTRDEASGVGAFDLAMDRRIRDTGSLGELNQAVLERRVAEDECQQLGLLL